jgi:hypothetical protein
LVVLDEKLARIDDGGRDDGRCLIKEGVGDGSELQK